MPGRSCNCVLQSVSEREANLDAMSLKDAFSSCLSRNGNKQELCTAWIHSAMLGASLKLSWALELPLVLASGC